MIKYYRLFDLLARKGMKKSDLLSILSSKTIAKLSKGANVTTDVIDKICVFLNCQPEDIMEHVLTEQVCNGMILTEAMEQMNISSSQYDKDLITVPTTTIRETLDDGDMIIYDKIPDIDNI